MKLTDVSRIMIELFVLRHTRTTLIHILIIITERSRHREHREHDLLPRTRLPWILLPVPKSGGLPVSLGVRQIQ